MTIDLNKLEQAVTDVEEVLLREFYKLKRVADKQLLQTVQLSESTQQLFRRNIEKMMAYLQASMAQDQLSLVDERQDTLRIRILLVEQLLERNIPYAYLERALGELIDPDVTPVVSQDGVVEPQEEWQQTGFFQTLKEFVPNLFVKEEAPSLVSAEPPNTITVDGYWNKLKRLLLLEKLMAVDELDLIPDQQKVDSLVTKEMIAKGMLAGFYWIDLDSMRYGEYGASDPSIYGRRLTIAEIKRKIKLNGGYVKGGLATFKATALQKTTSLNQEIKQLKASEQAVADKLKKKSVVDSSQGKAVFQPKKRKTVPVASLVKPKPVVHTEKSNKVLVSENQTNPPLGKASFAPIKKIKPASKPPVVKGAVDSPDHPAVMSKAVFKPIPKKKK